MKRVCMRKGRVVVIDATPASDKVDMYNYVEKLRDPSQVKALTFAELQEMFKEIGLTIINTDSFKIEMEAERLLQASFPNTIIEFVNFFIKTGTPGLHLFLGN
jgi:hypothetical protein